MTLSFPTAEIQAGPPFNDDQAVSSWKAVDRQAAFVRLKMLNKLQYRLDRLEKELPNFQSSMRWLKMQSDNESASLFLSYLDLIYSYLRIRNRDFELEQWCAIGIEVSRRLGRNPADILLRRGEAQYALGHWSEAEESWQSANVTSDDHDSAINANALFALGRLQINQGNYKTALLTLAEAEALFERLEMKEARLNVRSEVAAYYLNRRELDKALELYLDIDKNHRQAGTGESSDHSLLMLGVIYRHKKNYAEAIQYLSELFQRAEVQHHCSAMATAAHHLAWTYLEMGQIQTARTLCGQALSLYDEIQDPRGLSDGYEQLGQILLKQGRVKDAIAFIDKSAAMRRGLGNQPGLASCLRRQVFAHLMDGNYVQVLNSLVQTLLLYARLRMLSRQRMLALAKDFMMGFKDGISLRLSSKTEGNE